MRTKQYKQCVVQLNIHFTMMVENWAVVLPLYKSSISMMLQKTFCISFWKDDVQGPKFMEGKGMAITIQTVAAWSLSLNSLYLCRHDDSMDLYHHENCHIFHATCRSSGKLNNTQ